MDMWNKYNFALIKKNTISFEDEIFAATLFEHMGFYQEKII